MKDKISLTYKNNMSFRANVHGHEIILDTGEKFGGKNEGPSPKSFMLVALAGCTAMDVLSIITKMRVRFDDFRIEIEGDITEEHPKHFDKMHLKYILKGKDISREKVNNAISLSIERYCGVYFNYSKSINITHELVIEDQPDSM